MKVVDDPALLFSDMGCSQELINTFLAVADTGRYRVPVLYRLAAYIVGHGGRSNPDTPLFELAYFVSVLDAAGVGPTGDVDRLTFLLCDENVSPDTFRQKFAAQIDKDGWQRPGFVLLQDGVEVALEGSSSVHKIVFARMPVLTSIYEFVSSIDAYSFFNEFEDIWRALLDSEKRQEDLKSAASEIGRRMRRYRLQHIDVAAGEDRIVPVLKFLESKVEKRVEAIDIADEDIFKFWSDNNEARQFRTYRVVFEVFLDLVKYLDKRTSATSLGRASSLTVESDDQDFDLLELLSDEQELTIPADEWIDPLLALDTAELKEVNFFKTKTERAPIARLMALGPDVLAWPRAFFRLLSFAPEQAGITNWLRNKAGSRLLDDRIACAQAVQYSQRVEEHDEIKAHVQTLSFATMHIIDRLPENLKEQGITALRSLRRKGFGSDAETQASVFMEAVDPLQKISVLLDEFIEAADALSQKEPLDAAYDEDKVMFSAAFYALYSEAAQPDG